MRRFRRTTRRSSSRRRKAWGRGFAADSNLGAVGAGSILPASFWYKIPAGVLNTGVAPDGAIEPEDWTLVRTMVRFQAQVTPSGTDSTGIFIGAGLLVWEGNTDAVPSPGTYPVPVENGDADWLWHFVAGSGLGNSPIGNGFLGDTFGESDLQLQSRAKRKLSSRQGLLFVVEVSNALGIVGSNPVFNGWSFFGRSLFLLP